MKRRKLSSTEKILLVFPLLTAVLLAAQGPLRSWWKDSPANRWALPFTNPEKVQMMAFSNDSKLLAVLYWKEQKGGKLIGGGRLEIVNVPTQKVKQSFPIQSLGLIKWSPKNDLIAFDNHNEDAIYDLKSGQQIFLRKAPAKTMEFIKKWRSRDIIEIECTKDVPQKSRLLEQHATIDIRSGAFTPVEKWIPVDVERPRLVDRSPDGRWELYINPKSMIKKDNLELWDTKTKRKVKTFQGTFENARFLDNETITAYNMGSEMANDGLAFVSTFKLTDSRIQWRKFENIGDAEFLPHQRLAAFYDSHDDTIRIRDVRTWQLTQSFSAPSISNLKAFSPDGKFFAFLDNNRIELKFIPIKQKH